MSPEPYEIVELIRLKRDGGTLERDQIDWLIDAYTREVIADEQMSALAMAIFFRGLAREELSRWTHAMIASGERLNCSHLSRPTVDKHSTGGVGDKITLPLTPLVAACGAAVPQLAGRGLGHTGGTLDKLESIPGWRASISQVQMTRQLEDVGAVICAAGSGLAPADRKLYALRDVTGTVESIPLIASSIMSKKIAEGTGALVLDVKVGSGAFMKAREPATELAQAMVELGTAEGVRTVALLTDMSTPLGLTVGNALEVREAVEVLAGGGPPDVVELTVALAREMLAAAGVDDHDPAEVLASGSVMDVWRAMIRAQGGDPDAPLPSARETEVISAETDGVLTALDARAVGEAAWLLGAGRAQQHHDVQAAAGVELHARLGDVVRAGQPILTLHTDTPERFPRARDALAAAYRIAPEAVERPPLILDRIG
ncbi:MAG TPA: thymidine phosphorylase [Propionibacteriaceae bacterium]|nr:thymidine phosphorylase [Propionibacteriaceae bacterium]